MRTVIDVYDKYIFFLYGEFYFVWFAIFYYILLYVNKNYKLKWYFYFGHVVVGAYIFND